MDKQSTDTNLAFFELKVKCTLKAAPMSIGKKMKGLSLICMIVDLILFPLLKLYLRR